MGLTEAWGVLSSKHVEWDGTSWASGRVANVAQPQSVTHRSLFCATSAPIFIDHHRCAAKNHCTIINDHHLSAHFASSTTVQFLGLGVNADWKCSSVRLPIPGRLVGLCASSPSRPPRQQGVRMNECMSHTS